MSRSTSARKKIISNQKGSATVETTLSLSLVMTIVGGGLSIIYLSFAFVWLERASYEAVICLSTRLSQHSCEDRLRHETTTALPVGRISGLHMERTPARASVSLRFNIGGRDVFEHRDVRALPLSEGLTSDL
jgi:hypothetical protein